MMNVLNVSINKVNSSINAVNTSVNSYFDSEHTYFDTLIKNVSNGIIKDYKAADTALYDELSPKIGQNAADIAKLNSSLVATEESITTAYKAMCSSTLTKVKDNIDDISTKIVNALNTSINKVNSSLNTVYTNVNANIDDISTKIVTAFNTSINTKYEELKAMDSSLLNKISDTSRAIPLPQTVLNANESQLKYVYSDGTLNSNKTIVTTANTGIVQKDSTLQLTYGIWNGNSASIKYVPVPVATETIDGLLSYGSKVQYDNYDIRIKTNDTSIRDISTRLNTETQERKANVSALQLSIDTINNTTLPTALTNLENRLDNEYKNRFNTIEGTFNDTIKDVSTLLEKADAASAASFIKMDNSLNTSINKVYNDLYTLINNVITTFLLFLLYKFTTTGGWSTSKETINFIGFLFNLFNKKRTRFYNF